MSSPSRWLSLPSEACLPLLASHLSRARSGRRKGWAPQAERADLVKMLDTRDRILTVWSAVEQVTNRALESVMVGQEPEPQGQQSKSRKSPKAKLDVIPRAFLTKASVRA